MKKIDFHLHTVQTQSDRPFTYSFESLKRYVDEARLDAIAITNHNMFDKAQFDDISSSLDIVVFPGIEIDLEGCHLLLIADNGELLDFSHKCDQIEKLIPDSRTTISYAQLCEVFHDLSKYLLIPHYKKDPSICDDTLQKLKDHIYAGEVSSPKKFIYCLKDENSLVPVCFSDLRLDEKLSNIPSRQTYVDVGDLTLASLKYSLKDKQKVALSREEGHEFFDALPNGLRLSTGLNVILGERSTGKSHTLDVLAEQGEDEKIKHIRQFSLLEKEDEHDEKTFSSELSTRHSLITQEHLREFKEVVDSLTDIDLHEVDLNLERYISSLLKHATEAEKLDSFAKARLFSETKFNINDLRTLRELINSVEYLVKNSEYANIIEKHISKSQARALLVDLISEFNLKYELQLKKTFVNDLVTNIQSELKMQTAMTPIIDVDLYKTMSCYAKVDRFNLLVQHLEKPKQFFKKDIKGYTKVAERRPFNGAIELKNLSGRRLSFSEAYKNYSVNGYDYLCSLRKIAGLEETEHYKYFVKVDYKILNAHHVPVSGGERSEFRLLEEISDAQQYDMLLIDEPESSFDNIFLLNKVNKLIKEISQSMPVVVVTHNSTVGASIKPDYILYTRKKVNDNEVDYDIFSGHPGDKELIGLSGERIANHSVLLRCLEAGEAPYRDRGQGYEMLKS